MKVKVHLYSQAEACCFERVRNAYTKDGLYCVMTVDGAVYKFPYEHIFRIKETGTNPFNPPKDTDEDK